MEIIKVLAVILAVFIQSGNSRVITSNSNDNIERMLGLVEEALNDTKHKPTEYEENLADLLRLAETDLPSHEALQALSDDVSGESVIPPSEATISSRHKRSPSEPDCYKGWKTIPVLKRDGSWYSLPYPECRSLADSRDGFATTACASSIKKYGKRKCKESNFELVKTKVNGKIKSEAIPTSCSCA